MGGGRGHRNQSSKGMIIYHKIIVCNSGSRQALVSLIYKELDAKEKKRGGTQNDTLIPTTGQVYQLYSTFNLATHFREFI